MMLKNYENRFKYPMHENQGAKVSNFEKEKYKRQYLVNNELTLLIKYLYVLFTKKVFVCPSIPDSVYNNVETRRRKNLQQLYLDIMTLILF